MFSSLAAMAHGLAMNQTEIDSMVRNACAGDAMCESMMAELDMLNIERSTTDRASFLRRLKQLKALILHLQPEHRFARYCFYGCWCLPDADHTIEAMGYGQPVDPIDASCKRQASCYECAKIDHPGRNCVADQVQYNYQLNIDATDPHNHWKKSIDCLDDPMSGKNGGWSEKFSCRRPICECDKKLAEDLRENFEFWTVGHHQTQGTFVPTQECIHTPCANGNCGGGEGPPECCGEYPARFPFKTMGGARSCCGDRTFDTTIQECCQNGDLAAIGTC